tara:strand:- start:1713 stop:2750 length:1038 start_codon:yes stop_codon:yes gene_type:complete
MVSRAEYGPIRDSVTGNVKVHAAATFDLIAQANARVEWVALLPLGQSLVVEQNQTLIQLVQDDLDLRMDRLMLDREQFNERKELGSPTEILLSVKEKELLSMRELANIEKVSSHTFDLIDNEVERLRTQVKLEKLANTHFLENFELSMANLDAEIKKRSVNSPISGEFSSCFVAPGNQVFAGNVVGKVHAKERIIEVSLNEEEFEGVEVGLGAGVRFFSQGDKVFDANVSALSASVETSSGLRKLYLSLVEHVDSIPIGSSGRAEIIKFKKDSTLLIPTKALVGDFVVIEKDGVAQFRKVVTGARNLLTIEVIEGLNHGDKVVVETPHILNDGDRINSTVVGFQK